MRTVYEDIAVDYVDHLGSDVNVVNAARVSFAKEVKEFDLEKDSALIRYLVKHKHWSPLAHTAITVRCRVPIFLARQLVKHCVGGVWNEESRRYIDTTPTFYLPDEWHKRPDNAKQGAGRAFSTEQSQELSDMLDEHSTECLYKYEAMLKLGVAPEEARMFLPLSTNTNFMWTGSLAFFMRVIELRLDSHAQLAAQEFARKLIRAVQVAYPISAEIMRQHQRGEL